MQINQNAAAGSQLRWLFLLTREVCCSEALLPPLPPPREGLLCSIQTKHFIYPVGVNPTIPIQRRRYVSLFLAPVGRDPRDTVKLLEL